MLGRQVMEEGESRAKAGAAPVERGADADVRPADLRDPEGPAGEGQEGQQENHSARRRHVGGEERA